MPDTTPTPTVADRLRTIREGIDALWDEGAARRDDVEALQRQLDEIATGRVIELPDDLKARIKVLGDLIAEAGAEHRQTSGLPEIEPEKWWPVNLAGLIDLYRQRVADVESNATTDTLDAMMNETSEILDRIRAEGRVADRDDAIAALDWLTTSENECGGGIVPDTERGIIAETAAHMLGSLRDWLAAGMPDNGFDTITLSLNWRRMACELANEIDKAQLWQTIPEADPEHDRLWWRKQYLEILFLAVPARNMEWVIQRKLDLIRKEVQVSPDLDFIAYALGCVEADARGHCMTWQIERDADKKREG